MENNIKSTKAIFAARFRELRNNSKKTQAELAELLDCSQQTINVWENSQTNCDVTKINFPTVSALLKIANYFNVSTDWLLGMNNATTVYNKSSDNKELITAFNGLNQKGQQKAMEYITDLTNIQTYTEKENTLSA